MKAVKVRPFLPSGSDYPLAVQFYNDLGFEQLFSNDEGTLFRMNDTEFHLQNFHNEDLQSNYMLELCVQDLDAWWERIQTSNVQENYEIKVNAPVSHPSGKRVIHLIDPAGVLWHITE